MDAGRLRTNVMRQHDDAGIENIVKIPRKSDGRTKRRTVMSKPNNNNDNENKVTESKHDKFKRLASARTQTVLQKLDVLINCANGNNYEWTPDDGAKIVDVVQAKVDMLKDKLLGGEKPGPTKESFVL